MKKEKREIYLNLSEEIGTTLCGFCRYSECESMGCCEGYNVCVHPFDKLYEAREEGLDPDTDCWGFSPCYPLETTIELVSVILSQEYGEWGIRMYSKTALTVYGRKYDPVGNYEESSKVRIGHNGKESEESN